MLSLSKDNQIRRFIEHRINKISEPEVPGSNSDREITDQIKNNMVIGQRLRAQEQFNILCSVRE